MSPPPENFKKLRLERGTFRGPPPAKKEAEVRRPLARGRGQLTANAENFARSGSQDDVRHSPRNPSASGFKKKLPRTPKTHQNDGLERIQVFDQVVQRESLLLGLFGHTIDLFKGRDSADHLQHPISVKC